MFELADEDVGGGQVSDSGKADGAMVAVRLGSFGLDRHLIYCCVGPYEHLIHRFI